MPPKPSKRTASSAIKAHSSELEDGASPIFFWREYGSPHSYLSQWYPSPFTIPSTETTYSTAEQYMMHQKALLFSDPVIAAQILASTSPKDQKSLGRQVSNFDDEVWKAQRERIVEEASYWKFKVGRDEGVLKGEGVSLRERLEGAGDREIVEASPRDRIWGVGFGEKNAPKRREEWGLNLLGKALMSARKRLREEDARDDGKGEGEKGEQEVEEDEVEKTTEVTVSGRETKRRKRSKD